MGIRARNINGVLDEDRNTVAVTPRSKAVLLKSREDMPYSARKRLNTGRNYGDLKRGLGIPMDLFKLLVGCRVVEVPGVEAR